MLKFDANLTMLFNEVPFLERFAHAAKAGFKGIEFLFPYDFPKEVLVEKLAQNKLEQVLFNLPAGNWAGGERGIACLSDRAGEFQEGVGKAIDYARELKCKRVNCLLGFTPENMKPEKARKTLVDNLKFAADKLDKAGIRFLIEPLNNVDFARFYLTRTGDALQLFKEVDHNNLWLQYDIYHMQVMEGNLTSTIKENLPRIAHIQLADNPGRHEPGTGEINFKNLFRFIDEMGYEGWIGCEYRPSGRTEDSLGWVKQYLRKGVD